MRPSSGSSSEAIQIERNSRAKNSASSFQVHFDAMRVETVAMERSSRSGKQVAWNVSESGVEPLRLEELAITDWTATS